MLIHILENLVEHLTDDLSHLVEDPITVEESFWEQVESVDFKGMMECLREIAREGCEQDLINEVNELCPIMELDALIDEER